MSQKVEKVIASSRPPKRRLLVNTHSSPRPTHPKVSSLSGFWFRPLPPNLSYVYSQVLQSTRLITTQDRVTKEQRALITPVVYIIF